MKKKGFTLVELLVVIAIIALLMGILMPALAKVRQVAYRMVCGSNLGGIGKAILIYSNDNEEAFPRTGISTATWNSSGNLGNVWYSTAGAYNIWNGGRQPTITSCLYLLVKYADVTAKQFICKGDIGATPFDPTSEGVTLPTGWVIQDGWDFGSRPAERCSYAYHSPFAGTGAPNAKPLSPVMDPGSPLAADRNPWQDKNADIYLNDSRLDDATFAGTSGPYRDDDKKWVAATHQREGQNVLYLDGHVEFERFPNVGLDNDNIYRRWTTAPVGGASTISARDKQVGGNAPTGNGQGAPMDYKDSFLILETTKTP